MVPGRNALSFLFEEERAFHPPGLATLPITGRRTCVRNALLAKRLPRECHEPAPACAAIRTFGALPFASMIRTFRSGELRKHSPVGLADLSVTERLSPQTLVNQACRSCPSFRGSVNRSIPMASGVWIFQAPPGKRGVVDRQTFSLPILQTHTETLRHLPPSLHSGRSRSVCGKMMHP